MTDRWLTSELREGGAVDRASVTAHTTELVETQGAASVVARLELKYDLAEAGAPRSLVAKFASPHEPIRALMLGFGGYVSEVEFYRHFGADPGIPTPRCFHVDIDRATGVFVLLLEDMSDCRLPEGATAPVEDIELAVRHLAPFHARWWNHPQLRELEWLRYPGSPSGEVFMAQARAALAAALPTARERFGSEFPAALVTLTDRLLANFDALLETRRTRYEDSVTLVHGDYHPGQIFFESERGGRFAVFDWQTVNAGSGGDDLARIMVTGLSVEERERCEGRLIELYHSLLGEHGVTGYDIEQCREDFRQGLLMSLGINIIAAIAIDPELIEAAEASSGVSMAEVLFGRLAAAAEAHDLLAMVST